jgi:hypothetical protein
VTEEKEMKKKFGLEAITSIILLLFVWSGCFAEPPTPAKYEVYNTTGGHMNVNDQFEISKNAGQNSKLLKSGKLLEKWGLNKDSTIVLKEVSLGGGYGEPALCGHFDVDTEDHKVTPAPHGRKETPFGHGMRHGILIISEAPPEKSKYGVKIIWSARPLKPDQANSTGNCKKLDEDNHGGIAHAKNY